MKFLNLYSIFNENRQEPNQIIAKYYSDINPSFLDGMIKADPTSIIIDDKIQKIGSYVKFLAKLYSKDQFFVEEDLPRAAQYLKIYHANKSKFPNVDILKFNHLTDLGKLVRPYLDLKSGELTPIINQLLEEDSYKLLFEDEKWRIYQPLTEKAAATLGYGSEWCTTGGKYSLNKDYRNRTNRFSYYKKNLLIFVDQNTDKPVYQLHLKSEQFNDIHDGNLYHYYLNKFLEENIKICPIIFPELNNLNEETNVSNILKYTYLLPEIFQNKINAAMEKLIPIESLKLIKIIENNNISDERRIKELFKLFDINQKDFEDTIELTGKNQYQTIDIKSGFYKKQLRSYYDLENFLQYCSGGGSNFYDDYNDNDIDIAQEEDEIFAGELRKKLDEIHLNNIKTFEDVKDYIGENEYKKIKDAYSEKYNSNYSDQINTFSKTICNNVTKIIEKGYSSEKICIKFNKFLHAIKSIFIEKSGRNDFELKFEDVIEYIFVDNDLPEDYDSLYDKVYNNFEFDNSELIDEMQEIIYELISDKQDELLEKEKENNKTEEDRKKEQDDTIEDFKKTLNKLGFKDWKFENDEYIITFEPNKFDWTNKSIFATLINKSNNKKSEGYISAKRFDEDFRNNVKIEERIKTYTSFVKLIFH